MKKSKYLFLIVGPSASGKSHILNHLTKNGLQRIVSTTTRQMRNGEVDGYDYHFISKPWSESISKENGFVEKVEYAGVTYGVTHDEFENKIQKGNGVAFLIVEPKGIDKYKQYCELSGIIPITIYVDTHDSIRFERLKELAEGPEEYFSGDKMFTEQGINRIIRSAVHEKDWMYLHKYNFIISGTDSVSHNYGIISTIIEGLE